MRKPWISIVGLVLLLAPVATAQDTPTSPQRFGQGPGASNLRAMAALKASTVSDTPAPQVVVPPLDFSLSLEGSLDLGGFVFKDGTPFIHNDGGATYGNTALGLNALISTTPAYPFYGGFNTAVGANSLLNNTAGLANTGIGTGALFNNTTGGGNVALGAAALPYNTSATLNTAVGVFTLFYNNGNGNTAVGGYALRYATVAANNVAVGTGALFTNNGNGNTALGYSAMFSNTSGTGSTAVGVGAGTAWTTGTYNIALGAGAEGASTDSGVIRIGKVGYQTMTYIAGIRDADYTLTSAFDVDVCINNVDQLGPCTPLPSSKRFKQSIEEIDDGAVELGRLHPVQFQYKREAETSPNPPTHYGLIAEEVAEVFPQMVSYDGDGKPYTVRYELLTPLLLNELQRQQGILERRDEEMEALRSQVADLTRRLDQLTSGPD